MSLDKAINSGKEKRNLYYKSQSFDRSCRPHGGCPWCSQSKKHKRRIGEYTTIETIKEYKNESS